MLNSGYQQRDCVTTAIKMISSLEFIVIPTFIFLSSCTAFWACLLPNAFFAGTIIFPLNGKIASCTTVYISVTKLSFSCETFWTRVPCSVSPLRSFYKEIPRHTLSVKCRVGVKGADMPIVGHRCINMQKGIKMFNTLKSSLYLIHGQTIIYD